MSTEAQGYSVYIIEIVPRWYDLVAPPDRPWEALLLRRPDRQGRVGALPRAPDGRETRETSEAGRRGLPKIREAKNGVDLTNKVDVKLRRTMFEDYHGIPSAQEAEMLEASVVDELRVAGHVVYPRGLGQIPF